MELHIESRSQSWSDWRLWLWLALIAAVYFLGAKLGLALALEHDNVSAVWPPTGIAIAAVLLLGWRAAIAVFAGAFAANATTDVGLVVAATIATGNTLEALAAVFIVHQIAGGRQVFDSVGGVTKYVFIAAPLAVAISATIGTTALSMESAANAQSLRFIWMTWWLGDLVGAVVVAPLVVLWIGQRLPRFDFKCNLEALVLVVLTVCIGMAVFGGASPERIDTSGLGFLVLPPLVWAAFRFGRRGAVTVSAILAVIVILGTMSGHGPYWQGDLNQALLTVQGFIGVVTVTLLVMAVLVRQLRQTELAQLQTRSGLELALAAGNMGAWEWDIRAGRVKWSPSLQAIHGLVPGEFGGAFEDFQRDIHPEDRDRVLKTVQEALTANQPYRLKYRIIRPDGSLAWLEARGEIIKDESGPVLLTGVCTDVTSQRQAERRLAAEHAITRVLSDAASMDEAAPEIIRAFCEAVDGSVGGLWTPDTKGEQLCCTAMWADPSSTDLQPFIDATLKIRFQRGIGLPGRVWAGESAATVIDLLADLNFPRREAARQSGLQSGFAFPITSGTEFLGVIEFFTSHRFGPDESLLRMMTAIGQDVGQFMQRQRAESQLVQSQALNQSILESALDAIISIDQKGRIIEWNPAASETFGYTREEALNSDLAELMIPASMRDRHRRGLQRFGKGESSVVGKRIEMPSRHASGREMLVELTVTATEHHGHTIFTAHLRDITARTKSEQDQRFLAAIVNTSDDAIISKNLDGIIRTWNSGATQMFGYTADQAIGRPITMLIPPERLSEEIEILRRMRNGDHIQQYETVRLTKDGRQIDVSLSVSPIRDALGVIVGASKIARDITASKQIERELQHHRERLEDLIAERTAALEASQQQLRIAERMTAMGTLSTGIGHDIGNLLLPMRSRLEVLRSLDLSPEAQEHAKAIEYCVQHLYTLVRGLRLMAQDPEQMEGEPLTDLSAWMEETLPLFRSMVHEQICMSTQIAADLPKVAVASHVLTQAVRNLVKNSRDAIGQNVPGRIVIRADLVNDNTVRLAVIDDGSGMTPDVKARAMEPFFTTKTRSLSTGLGLSTVHGMMRSANAMIQLYSPVPHELKLPAQAQPGTAVLLLLPVATVDDEADEDEMDRTAAVSISDLRARSVMTNVLQSMGIAAQVTENGDPGDVDIWIIEPTSQPDAARRFLEGGQHREVYLIGEATEDWRKAGVKFIDPSIKPSAIRAAMAE